MVIPDAGFDVLPTIPTVIEVTATKKNPIITRRIIVTKLIGRPGKSQRNKTIAIEPRINHLREISFSVLSIT
jgi:hypothetical protein